LKHEHTPQLTLGLNFDENNGALNGKKKMKPPKEGHHLNKGITKIKSCQGLRMQQMLHLKLFLITKKDTS